MLAQTLELGQELRARLRGFMGMEAESCPEMIVRFDELKSALEFNCGPPQANGENRLDPSGAGALQHRRTVRIKARIAQVGMGINQAHSFTSSERRRERLPGR